MNLQTIYTALAILALLSVIFVLGDITLGGGT